MRKISRVLLLLVAVLSLTTTAFAREGALKMSRVKAQQGKPVYITVELTESVEGDSVGINYAYNAKHLKPLVDSCSWVRQGFLQNFDKANPFGVWGAEESTDLKGGVCVLAFEVLPDAKFIETTVSCVVTVKDGSGTAGTYTAETTVSMDCRHTYGNWADHGDQGHGRICTVCNEQETSAHQWNEGIVAPADKGNIVTYTCQVCGSMKTFETSDPVNIPTMPPASEPTHSQAGNQQSGTDKPSSNQNGGQGAVSGDNQNSGNTTGNQEIPGETEHNHSHENLEATEPGHNHEGQPGEDYTYIVIVVIALLAVIGGGTVFAVRRNKK